MRFFNYTFLKTLHMSEISLPKISSPTINDSMSEVSLRRPSHHGYHEGVFLLYFWNTLDLIAKIHEKLVYCDVFLRRETPHRILG